MKQEIYRLEMDKNVLFADGPISHYFLVENPIKSTKVSINT